MEKQVFRQNKQVAYNQILFILYTVITTIVYVLPYTKLRVPYVLAAFLMLAPMPFLLLRRDNLVKYAILLIGVSLVLFFGYLLFCDYPLAEAINEAVRNLRFFMPVLWGFYALRYCSNKQRAFFLVVFLLMTFFILINTLQALQQDPWVARLLAQSTSTSSCLLYTSGWRRWAFLPHAPRFRCIPDSRWKPGDRKPTGRSWICLPGSSRHTGVFPLKSPGVLSFR